MKKEKMKKKKTKTPEGKLSLPLIARQSLLLEMRKVAEKIPTEIPTEFEIKHMLDEYWLEGWTRVVQDKFEDLFDRADNIMNPKTR